MSDDTALYLFRGATDFVQLELFIKRLIRELDADDAAMQFIDNTNWTFPITISSSPTILSEDYYTTHNEVYAKHSPRIHNFFAKSFLSSDIYICSDHFDEESRRQEPYFTEFLASYDIGWTAGLWSRISATHSVNITIVRRRNRPPFDEITKQKLRPIADVLNVAANLIFVTQKEKLIRNYMNLAIKKKAPPSTCFDEQLRLIWSNAESKDYQHLNAECTVIGNKLTGITDRGKAVVQRVQDVARGLTREAVIRIRDGAQSYFKFEAVHLTAEMGRFAKHGAKGVAMFVTERIDFPDQFPNAELWNTPLSTSEQDIVRLIAQGNSTAQIAQIRNVKPTTVRTQLKKIYSKLGLRSQVELVAHYYATSQDRMSTTT